MHKQLLYVYQIMKKIVFISLFSVVITLFNCSEMKSELIYLKNLKNNISSTYDLKNITVKMTSNNHLKIILENSRLNKYSPQDKRELAKQIGILALKNVEDNTKIEKGVLIFLDSSNGPISKTSDSTSYNLFTQ